MSNFYKRANLVRVVPGNNLSPEVLDGWKEILCANAELQSPFFQPRFTQAVAAVVPEVEVGILERDGKIIAILPFERKRFGAGHRLRLCDYQGLIAKEESDFDVEEFVRKCGLRSWDFNHLLASQPQLKKYHNVLRESPFINVSNGFEAYLTQRRAEGKTELIKRCGTKMRKMEREIGPLRMEAHVPSEAILKELLKWRENKYGSRHAMGLLTTILSSLMQEEDANLKGMLTVLYAGNEVTAAHFGLRANGVWHYWFPAYNPQYEKYSPGLALLLKMIETAPKIGLGVIDLGKGDMDYKTQLMNGAVPLAEGAVISSWWLDVLRKGVAKSRTWVRPWRGILSWRPGGGLPITSRTLPEKPT